MQDNPVFSDAEAQMQLQQRQPGQQRVSRHLRRQMSDMSQPSRNAKAHGKGSIAAAISSAGAPWHSCSASDKSGISPLELD